MRKQHSVSDFSSKRPGAGGQIELHLDDRARGAREEIKLLRERLDMLAGKLSPEYTAAESVEERARAAPVSERDIVRILQQRAARAKFFDADLFADPAWDILLDLYAAELSHRRVSVSSLCVAANVPATTALRWIKNLEQRDLIMRSEDRLDARRFFMRLSKKARTALENYFTSMKSDELPIQVDQIRTAVR